MIYDYTLVNGRAPSWVNDGGYFPDPDTDKLIGYSTANSSSIPNTSTSYTKQELINRVLAIHEKYPMETGLRTDESYSPTLTNAEVTTLVENWATARGL